jgi:hypothetical protein
MGQMTVERTQKCVQSVQVVYFESSVEEESLRKPQRRSEGIRKCTRESREVNPFAFLRQAL